MQCVRINLQFRRPARTSFDEVPCGEATLLHLRLQLIFVGCDKGADIIGHVQQPDPLFFVQRNGKAPHPMMDSAPFSLTFIRIPDDAPFLRAAFSARRRSSSAFISSSAIEPPISFTTTKSESRHAHERRSSRTSLQAVDLSDSKISYLFLILRSRRASPEAWSRAQTSEQRVCSAEKVSFSRLLLFPGAAVASAGFFAARLQRGAQLEIAAPPAQDELILCSPGWWSRLALYTLQDDADLRPGQIGFDPAAPEWAFPGRPPRCSLLSV